MAKGNPKNRMVPLLMIVLGAILLLGGGGWYLSQVIQRPDTPPTDAVVQEDNYQDIARISLVDAKTAYDSGDAIFLDVRDAQSYALRHIPGARSIPLTELPNRTGELNPDDWIITY